MPSVALIGRLLAFLFGVGACLDTVWVRAAGESQQKDLHLSAFHKTVDPALGSWGLSVDDRGQAVINLAGKSHRFRVSEERQEELRRALKRERFFELGEELGGGFVGGPFRQIEVTLDGKRKQVMLLSGLSAEKDREEVKRALRVWAVIRGLFDFPEAADSRAEDRLILEH